MPAAGPFRALSLDLWFTTVYYGPGLDDRWEEARLEVLAGRLYRSGAPIGRDELTAALEASRGRLVVSGRDPVATDPAELLAITADLLGARVRGSLHDAAEELSAAGIRETPPTINPEAVRLVRGLAERGIPSVLLTNSARRASTWSAFLDAADRPPFRHVVSSADVGKRKPDREMFVEAARRVGLPPAELLHVGDRWDLDVAGALAAGCGAALYRGLWSRYPPDQPPPDAGPVSESSGVRVVDRLDELLAPELWAP